MDICLQQEVPGYVEEPTMMFAYPTCTADVYTPTIEQILLPGKQYPSRVVKVKVATGRTAGRTKGSRVWKLQNMLSSIFREPQTLDFSGRFIYDTRLETDKNIAHILEGMCSYVLFAQQLLSQHLNQQVRIHVITQANPSELVTQVFDALNIPMICTDETVYGEVVEVLPRDAAALFGIQAELFNVDFKNYQPTTPERVFISRKGNRRLINNDEVIQFLEQRGFTTYYFEDLTPSEEWSIARNTKVVVAVHGAGTANFIFNRLGLDNSKEPGSGIRMIELVSPSFALRTYQRFAHLLNGKWCAVRGQITPETLRYLDFSNQPRNPLISPMKDPYKIDCNALQLALDYFEVKA